MNDIDSIWHYTVKHWSIKQAESYYNSIIDTIELICQNPELGKSVSEVKDTHRSMKIGSHMIVYKYENSIIIVDRILHQRVDIDNQSIY